MLKLGWLSPRGELVECNSYEHIAVAKELVNKYNLDCKESYDTILENNGWAHIGISALSHKYCIWWKNFLTDEQKIFLEPYFEDKENVEYGSVCNWDYELDNRI